MSNEGPRPVSGTDLEEEKRQRLLKEVFDGQVRVYGTLYEKGRAAFLSITVDHKRLRVRLS